MIIFGFLGFLEFDQYWRWLALAALAVFELHTVTRPYFVVATNVPAILNPFIESFPLALPIAARSQYLPFQAIQVAHRALITFFVAMTRLIPLLRAPDAVSGTEEQKLTAYAEKLEKTIGRNIVESTRLLGLDFAPFRSAAEDSAGQSGNQLGNLKEKLKQWMITNTVRGDPQVNRAFGAAVARRGGQSTGVHE